MFKLFVIGIGDNRLTREQERILSTCPLIVGAERLTALTAHLPCSYADITPLPSALETIKTNLEKSNVAVLASGDPLFYGIGKRLLNEFPENAVQIFPALSAIQRACALFGISWDDAKIVSLHGRTCNHIPGLLLTNQKSLVLTDKKNSPDIIARQLLDYLRLIGETELVNSIRVLVAEDLSLESENLFCGTVKEAANQSFSHLNILCLLLPEIENNHGFNFGLSENDIQHSRGLITKNEVRAATLHQLQLPAKGIFWDIGAGSGSLSIEAARANPDLTVFSIEHKAEELTNIKNNIAKFRCYNIVPVPGRAPEALARLPNPDRAFIGGSSGALPEIVELLEKRLPLTGRLVINAVIEKTAKEAPAQMRRHGFSVTSSIIKVTRTEPDGSILDFNPITIMTGTR